MDDIPQSPSRTESVPTPPKGSRLFVAGALIFAALLVGGGVYLAQTRQGKTVSATARSPHRDGAVSVGMKPVEKGRVSVVLSALGTVTPRQNVTVRTQINGILTKVAFTEGQTVAQGDFLAEVDPRPYENARAKAQGQLVKDQALLKEAETTLSRYRILMGKKALSQQQLDSQISLADQYRGTVQTDQAEIETAQLNLSYCHITAPVSGRVGLRQVDPGNYVQTSDTNGIVTLAEMQPISVLFAVPEDRVPSLLARQKNPAPIEVSAYDRTQKTLLATGSLAAMDNQINAATGTVKLRALFDNTDGALFPQQFVNIRLTLETEDDALLIPVAAVQQGQKGAFVYRITPDNKAVVQDVTLGATEGDAVVVHTGLSLGDRVVTDGVDMLQDGASVLIVSGL